MKTLAARLALVAAIAIADPSLATESDAARCPEDAALVSGPPAPELFDPEVWDGVREVVRDDVRASWCERYDARGRTTRVGLYTDSHPDGTARTLAHFENDLLEGDAVILHRNGRIWLRTRFTRGAVDGPYEVFRAGGAPWLRAEFRQGVATGTHTLHHGDGSIAAESHYVDGIEQGTSRAWWPNGVLRHELEVVDGVWSGRFASWFENGGRESEGHYAACPDDATATSCELIGAARHGHWQTWHANGEPASRAHWRYGEQTGTSVEWDEVGAPEVVRIHQNGAVVQEIWAPAQGEPAGVSSAALASAARVPRAD